MVVDDDKLFNLIAKVLLRDAGISHSPIVCSNGQEALAKLRREINPNSAFLLFLDINMPLMSGWEVLDTLQSFPYQENILVVIVTSSINKADKERAKAYPQLIDYLVKPIKKENLLTLKSSSHLANFFSRR